MPFGSGSVDHGTRPPLTVQNGLSTILKVLILICVLLLGAAATKLYVVAQTQQTVREHKISQHQTFEQLEAFSTLQEQLGYAKFIHDFKNGVLRRDIALLVKARRDIDQAESALIWLRNGGADAAKVDRVAATIRRYREMTYLAAQLIEQGASSEEIDARVVVDDTDASKAMSEIRTDIDVRRKGLNDAFELQVREVRNLGLMIYLTSAGLVIMSFILLFVYLRGRSAAARMSETLESLGRINASIVERVERMARFLGTDNQLLESTGQNFPDSPAKQESVEELLAQLERNLSRIVRRSAEQDERLMLQSAALKTSNEELTSFSYVASHDLQEPLRKIQSNISLIELRHKDELTPKLAERLERLTASATKMRRLIEDLLQYSRSGTREMETEILALNLPVRLAAADFDEEVESRGGNLRIIIPDEFQVLGDRTLLVQCFTNLFSNALKYARMELPPEILVSANRRGRMVDVTIVDNGIGFSKHYIESIFAPFKRLHGSSEYEGSGVGLSIVKKVIERHGGTVTARSSGPGTGATFTLTLPLVSEEEKQDV